MALGSAEIPCPMLCPALFDYHCHDSILICLSSLFVRFNDLVYSNAADKISCDEYKITRYNSMSVDVSHRISWRKCLFGGHDGYNLDS